MCILAMPTKTRYGDSPWVLTFPASRRPTHPKLRGEFDCDVAIIGGGLTGIATAYACAVAGLETMVVEADRLGAGTAGRSAGLLLPEPGPEFRELVQAHGLRWARTIFESWRRASLDAAALLRRASIQCALVPVDTATVSADEKSLRREYDARTAYKKSREICHDAGDYVTMKLFEQLLADEEGHIDFLETQLDLLNSLGEAKYGQLNADSANEAEDGDH